MPLLVAKGRLGPRVPLLLLPPTLPPPHPPLLFLLPSLRFPLLSCRVDLLQPLLRKAKGWWRLSLTRTPRKGLSLKGVGRWWLRPDENQIKEAFINEGRGHSPSHLKFFLLVFSKLKEDIK